MNISIRRLYLYIASLIGLILIIIAAVGLVRLGLETWVFTKADSVDLRYVCNQPTATLDRVEGVAQQKPAEALTDEDCEARMAEERTARRQREAAQDVAMIVVGIPVWFYHWNKVKEDREQ